MLGARNGGQTGGVICLTQRIVLGSPSLTLLIAGGQILVLTSNAAPRLFGVQILEHHYGPLWNSNSKTTPSTKPTRLAARQKGTVSCYTYCYTTLLSLNNY